MPLDDNFDYMMDVLEDDAEIEEDINNVFLKVSFSHKLTNIFLKINTKTTSFNMMNTTRYIQYMQLDTTQQINLCGYYNFEKILYLIISFFYIYFVVMVSCACMYDHLFEVNLEILTYLNYLHVSACVDIK